MKKLRLEIDGLKVESFQALPARGGRGTVRGAESYYTLGCTEGCGGTTVIPHYCYENSDVMDCQYDPSHNSCGCVVGP